MLLWELVKRAAVTLVLFWGLREAFGAGLRGPQDLWSGRQVDFVGQVAEVIFEYEKHDILPQREYAYRMDNDILIITDFPAPLDALVRVEGLAYCFQFYDGERVCFVLTRDLPRLEET